MTFARKLVASVGTATAAYGWLVRPRLARWGASDEEVAGPYPGAGIVPDGRRGPTMAVTIDAPPDRVWPWLVQLGGDRGGWYSWDRLDNAGRPSARRIHPEWQHLAVGDAVLTGPVATARCPRGRWSCSSPSRFLALHGLSDLRGRPSTRGSHDRRPTRRGCGASC